MSGNFGLFSSHGVDLQDRYEAVKQTATTRSVLSVGVSLFIVKKHLPGTTNESELFISFHVVFHDRGEFP